jgi:hypothetical protein
MFEHVYHVCSTEVLTYDTIPLKFRIRIIRILQCWIQNHCDVLCCLIVSWLVRLHWPGHGPASCYRFEECIAIKHTWMEICKLFLRMTTGSAKHMGYNLGHYGYSDYRVGGGKPYNPIRVDHCPKLEGPRDWLNEWMLQVRRDTRIEFLTFEITDFFLVSCGPFHFRKA